MYDGTSDIHKLGIFDKWNGLTRSTYYNGSCGAINGTSGELWPPIDGHNNIAVFSPDICRYIYQLIIIKTNVLQNQLILQ